MSGRRDVLFPCSAGRGQHHDWKSPAGAVLTVILAEFGDLAVTRTMLLGLKARAEKIW
jgi:hypothetical protein